MNAVPKPHPRTMARAKRIWLRLTQWYGTRWTEAFGPEPSEDWIRAVDRASDAQMIRAIEIVRSRNLTHPPTLPEFEAALREGRDRTDVQHGPTPIERLDSAARKLNLSNAQLSAKWTWLSNVRDTRDPAFEIVGVVIPHDRDKPATYPSHRLMLSELPV